MSEKVVVIQGNESYFAKHPKELRDKWKRDGYRMVWMPVDTFYGRTEKKKDGKVQAVWRLDEEENLIEL